MALPLGSSGDRHQSFLAADQTGSRSLDTDYTNGPFRRLVIVSLACSTADGSSQAIAGYHSQLGGSTVVCDGVVGFAAIAAEDGRFSFTFPVDPGGTYRVSSGVSGSGAIGIQKWLEVDL